MAARSTPACRRGTDCRWSDGRRATERVSDARLPLIHIQTLAVDNLQCCCHFACKFLVLTGRATGRLGERQWSARQGNCTRIDESGWLRFHTAIIPNTHSPIARDENRKYDQHNSLVRNHANIHSEHRLNTEVKDRRDGDGRPAWGVHPYRAYKIFLGFLTPLPLIHILNCSFLCLLSG